MPAQRHDSGPAALCAGRLPILKAADRDHCVDSADGAPNSVMWRAGQC